MNRTLVYSHCDVIPINSQSITITRYIISSVIEQPQVVDTPDFFLLELASGQVG